MENSDWLPISRIRERQKKRQVPIAISSDEDVEGDEEDDVDTNVDLFFSDINRNKRRRKKISEKESPKRENIVTKKPLERDDIKDVAEKDQVKSLVTGGHDEIVISDDEEFLQEEEFKNGCGILTNGEKNLSPETKKKEPQNKVSHEDLTVGDVNLVRDDLDKECESERVQYYDVTETTRNDRESQVGSVVQEPTSFARKKTTHESDKTNSRNKESSSTNMETVPTQECIDLSLADSSSDELELTTFENTMDGITPQTVKRKRVPVEEKKVTFFPPKVEDTNKIGLQFTVNIGQRRCRKYMFFAKTELCGTIYDELCRMYEVDGKDLELRIDGKTVSIYDTLDMYHLGDGDAVEAFVKGGCEPPCTVEKEEVNAINLSFRCVLAESLNEIWKTIRFSCPKNSTIKEIRSRLGAYIDRQGENLKILIDGEIMLDTATLETYDIEGDEIIDVICNPS